MGSEGSLSSPVRSGRPETDEAASIGMAFGGIVPIAAAGLLVMARGHIENTNVALLLTVVVVAAATIGGRAAGATAAVSAAMSFNFFHTRPYLSLKIDSSDDIETTVLLLMVGLAVGQLARRARSASAEVRTSRSELNRIRRLADEVACGKSATVVLHDAETQLAALLDLEACRFEQVPYPAGRDLPVLERHGAIAGQRLRARGGGELGLEWPAGPVALPVLARGVEVGRFVLHPTRQSAASLEERVVAVALADQAGGALVADPPRASR